MPLIYKNGQYYESGINGELKPAGASKPVIGSGYYDAQQPGLPYGATQKDVLPTGGIGAIGWGDIYNNYRKKGKTDAEATAQANYDWWNTSQQGQDIAQNKGWDTTAMVNPSAPVAVQPVQQTPVVTTAPTNPAVTTPVVAQNTGSQQDFLPSSSSGELMQLIQDRLIRDLNNNGYTEEEKAMMSGNAQKNFDASLAADLRTLENMGEGYGWRSEGAPELGGQARSMFGDYFTNRALANENMQFDLAKQFIDRATVDKQNAIQNALAGEGQLYSEVRGDFADAMASGQYGMQQQAQDYDMLLQSLGFDQTERTNLVNNYLQGKGLDTSNLLNYLGIQEGTQANAGDILQAASYGQSNVADIYKIGVDAGLDEDSLLGLVLAWSVMGGNGTGTGTGDTGDTGNFDIGDIDWSNPLTWGKSAWKALSGGLGSILGIGDIFDNSGLPKVGASFTIGNKTYKIGAAGEVVDAVTGAGTGTLAGFATYAVPIAMAIGAGIGASKVYNAMFSTPEKRAQTADIFKIGLDEFGGMFGFGGGGGSSKTPTPEQLEKAKDVATTSVKDEYKNYFASTGFRTKLGVNSAVASKYAEILTPYIDYIIESLDSDLFAGNYLEGTMADIDTGVKVFLQFINDPNVPIGSSVLETKNYIMNNLGDNKFGTYSKDIQQAVVNQIRKYKKDMIAEQEV